MQKFIKNKDRVDTKSTQNKYIKKDKLEQEDFMPRRRRRISKRQRKSRMRRVRFLLLITFIISILWLIIYSLNIFFKISQIELVGSSMSQTSSIINNINIKVGDSLILFEKNGIKNEITEKYPYVKSVDITRKYPNKLLIEITEYDAFYTIYFAGMHYAVSREGVVLEPIKLADADNLVRIIGFDTINLEVGKVITSSDVYKFEALQIVIDDFEKFDYLQLITEIDLTKTYDIILKNSLRYQIEIGDTQDLEQKLKMLDEVMRKLTPSDTVVIDLSNKAYARFRTEDVQPSVYP